MPQHWKLSFLPLAAAAGYMLSYRFLAEMRVHGIAATIALVALAAATCAGWVYPRMTLAFQFLIGLVCIALWNTPLAVLSFALLIPFFRLVYCGAAVSAALSALSIFALAWWPIFLERLPDSPNGVTLAAANLGATLALGLAAKRYEAKLTQRERFQQMQQEDLVELLHNSVAADLTSVVINLEALAIESKMAFSQQTGRTTGAPCCPADTMSRIEECSEKIRQSLSNIRVLINSLSNHNTESSAVPAFDAIITSGTTALKNAGLLVNAHIAITRTPESEPVCRVLEQCVKETATNIIKWAPQGSTVTIRCYEEAEFLTLTFSSKSFSQTPKVLGGGTGIPLLRKKLQSVSGNVYYSLDASTWTVAFAVPLPADHVLRRGNR